MIDDELVENKTEIVSPGDRKISSVSHDDEPAPSLGN